VLEHKSIPAEFKADVDKRLIKGYASVFGNVDSYGDMIIKGAFAQSIAEKFVNVGDGKSKIKMLWLHDAPLGLPKVLKEDDHGLYFEARASKTQLGDDALELVRDGVVDEASIGFKAKERTYVDPDDEAYPDNLKRILQVIDLYEVSPVVWGANSATAIEAAGLDMRDLDTALDTLDRALKGGHELTQKQLERLACTHQAFVEAIGGDPDDERGAELSAFDDMLAEMRAFTTDINR
jgi:HK97 family phage prohead protease